MREAVCKMADDFEFLFLSLRNDLFAKFRSVIRDVCKNCEEERFLIAGTRMRLIKPTGVQVLEVVQLGVNTCTYLRT